MIIHRLHSFKDYRRHVARMERIYSERRILERDLQKNHSRAFTVAGFSYPARQEVKFRADFAYSNGTDVNWREWLVCPVTGLNNRLRAAVHLADSERRDELAARELAPGAALRVALPKVPHRQRYGDVAKGSCICASSIRVTTSSGV
jgi:hypothetical protein